MPGFYCTAAFMACPLNPRSISPQFREVIRQRCWELGVAEPDTILGSVVLVSTPSQRLEDYEVWVREAPYDIPWDEAGKAIHFMGPLSGCGPLFGMVWPPAGDPWWERTDVAILVRELSGAFLLPGQVHYYFATYSGGVLTPEIYTSMCVVTQNKVQRRGTPRGIGYPGSEAATVTSCSATTSTAAMSSSTIR